MKDCFCISNNLVCVCNCLKKNITFVVALALYLFLIINPVHATELKVPPVQYPKLPLSGEKATDFTPNGWKIEIQLTGDINTDNIEDTVLVLRENNPKNIVKHNDLGENPFDTNPRMLVLLIGKTDGGYELFQYNKKFIPRRTDPLISDYLTGIGTGGVEIQQGLIKVLMSVFYSAGSWEFTNYIFTFRWQNKQFELIGYDRNTTNRSSGRTKDISINYSTRKAKISCNDPDSDEKGKVIWKKLPSNKIWTIDTIGNGIEFNPGINVNCN